MTYHLFDNRIIEQAEGVHPVLGRVQKHAANPLFGEDQPWEVRFDNLYANVIADDDGLFKCWYNPFIIDHTMTETPLAQRPHHTYANRLAAVWEQYGPAAREMGVCYATSPDGLHWSKPGLGIVEFGGTRANNLVMRHAHGSGIFKDRHATDPVERYKMVLYHLQTRRMMVAWSPDGLHWSAPLHCPEVESPRRENPANPIVWMGDTHNNALWAPSLEKYVLITRMWRQEPRRRLVGRAESHDFRHWSASQPVFEGRDADDQLYAMPIFAYGRGYLGLPMIFHAGPDTVDCELAWSPDTITWQRICPGTPLIPRGASGSYDSGCIYAAAIPIPVGDEVRLYYGGNNGPHTNWRDGFLCLATLPRDRFAGLANAANGHAGLITTQPLPCTGRQLWINTDAGHGQVRVGVAAGEGLSVDESIPIVGDVIDGVATWRNEPGLTALVGRSIRLRFELNAATLFAFGFRS
jgi:hypothetical protein